MVPAFIVRLLQSADDWVKVVVLPTVPNLMTAAPESTLDGAFDNADQAEPLKPQKLLLLPPLKA